MFESFNAKGKSSGLTQSCQNPSGSEMTNNLDSDQASLVVFQDIMYIYIMGPSFSNI